MKIIQLAAENVKRLRVVSIKPDGSLIQLSGGNGEGKSSVLGLRAFPGERFRISENDCYFSGSTLYLYTAILKGEKWLSFAKGTPAELRREVISL